MEDPRLKVINNQIKTIFNTMDYSEMQEDTSEAKRWIDDDKNFQNVSKIKYEIRDINNELLRKIACYDDFNPYHDNLGPINMSDLEMSVFMNKLADKLEAQQELICQLELLVRGFLVKETKKSLSLFVDYLRWYSGLVNPEGKSEKETPEADIAYIPGDSSLAMIGYILGNWFAEKRVILLNTNVKTAIIVNFIQQTCFNLGYPKNFFHQQTNLRDISNFYKSRIPVIIFENGDLDSATDCAIQATWGHQGLMPWSANTLLVQESIFDTVVDSIKRKLRKVRMGSALNKNVDFSWPVLLENFEEKLETYVTDAAKRGIEVFQSDPNNKFSPTICIGGRVYGNNVFVEDNDLPVLTILPFRNTVEAVSLVNNGSRGLAASVWSENVGLVNEVVSKLEVGTVWVNSHGLFQHDVTFFHQICKLFITFNGTKLSPGLGDQNLNSTVISLKKSQKEWMKLSLPQRQQRLIKVAFKLDEAKSILSNKTGCTQEEIEEWISLFAKATSVTSQSRATYYSTYTIKSYEEPMGVVAIQYSPTVKRLILAAIAKGNAVLVLTDSEEKLVKELCALLPGIMACVNYNDDVLKTDIDIFLSKFEFVTSRYTKVPSFKINETSCYTLITKVKNVWCNSGDSFL